MTSKERYNLIIEELADVIKQKNETIAIQSWQIQDLNCRLEEAENYKQKGGDTATKN